MRTFLKQKDPYTEARETYENIIRDLDERIHDGMKKLFDFGDIFTDYRKVIVIYGIAVRDIDLNKDFD